MKIGRLLLRLAWIVPLIAGLVGGGGAARRRAGGRAPPPPGGGGGGRPGAPAFRLPALDGRTLDLAALRGRPIVLNFWASWCVPCKDEAPLLERAWKTYRDKGLLVIGVNIQDLEADARRFVAEVGITYPNVRDRDGKANRAYGITGIPEKFFVSPDGRIIKKFPGAVVEWRLWEEAIAQVLASGPGEEPGARGRAPKRRGAAAPGWGG